MRINGTQKLVKRRSYYSYIAREDCRHSELEYCPNEVCCCLDGETTLGTIALRDLLEGKYISE